MLDMLAIAQAGMSSMVVELVLVLFFAIGCWIREKLHGHKLFSKSFVPVKVVLPFNPKLKSIIETEAAAGHREAVLQAWREGDAAAPKEVMLLVVQSFVDAEPEALVKEMLAHIWKHDKAGNLVNTVLDVVARAGRLDLMEEFWRLLPRQTGIRRTGCAYDILLGGFANAGDLQKLSHYERAMKRDRLWLSPRGLSLIIKGHLKNGFLDQVLEKLVEMTRLAYEIPPFAVAQFFRVANEAGRSSEMFTAAVENDLEISLESYSVIIFGCVRSGDLELLKKVEDAARNSRPQRPEVFEMLIRVYMHLRSDLAIEIFRELQRMRSLSEGFCVRLLARCAEKKLINFAEEVVKHCRKTEAMSLSTYSALMKVYAYSGFYDKACDLYKEIKKEGIEPDAMMYGCLMKFSVECGRHDLLEEISGKVPHLDIQHYMSMIRSAGMDVQRAFVIFERLRKSQVSVDVAAYNCLLDVCVRAGDMTRARALMKEMGDRKMMDSITYNTFIKGLCHQKDIQGAKQVMHQMENAGIAANQVTYNCFLNATLIKGDIPEAWNLLRSMEANGIAPDRYTAATMMKSLKRVSPPGHAARCFELLDRSKVDPCEDEILLNLVLEAALRHRGLKRLEWILNLYETSKLLPSAPTCGSLIKAYGILKRPERCWTVWKEMTVERGLEPSHIVLGCMLDALVTNGSVDDAERLFYQHESTNIVLYSILIKGFATTHQPKRAMALWRSMREKGLKMNTVGYNSVIDSQARLGGVEEVSEILAAMAEEKVKPDGVTHSIVVKAYCVRGEVKKAREAIRYMQESQVQHDAVVYNTCIDACCKMGRLDVAELVLQDMVAWKVAPTNFTLGIMVKTSARAKQLDKAFALMEELPKLGNFRPNQQVWTSLVLSCLNNDAPEKALKVFNEMHKLGVKADGKAYQVLITGLAKHGCLQKSVELVEEVYGLKGEAAKDVDLDKETLETLFRAIRRKGLREDLGLQLLERLSKASPVSSLLLSDLGGA